MATQNSTKQTRIRLNPITIGQLFVPVVLVLLWSLLSRALGATLLPGPVLTLEAIVAGVEAGWVVPNLLQTLTALGIGFLIAAFFGLLDGVFLGVRETAYDVFEPFVLSVYSVPKIILFPVFVFLFQIGIETKIAFAVFHGFFPMLIITMGAIREIDDIYIDISRSLRLTRYQKFRHVIFPFILVQLVVALRLTFSLSFLGVILAELFASKSGLGLLLQHAMANHETQRIMAIVTILMVIAFLGNIAFYIAQRRLEERWNMTADNGGMTT